MAQMQLDAAALPLAPPRRLSLALLGVVPFFVFALMFLIWPTAFLMVGAFQDADGHFTLENIRRLCRAHDPQRLFDQHRDQRRLGASAARSSASSSPAAVVLGGLPRWMRPTLMTFCGVASNFAGVPLAFAFLATLGRTGLVTALLINYLGFNLYATGFNLLSFSGPDAHLPLFPDPADGADPDAGARRAEARMARGGRDPRRARAGNIGAMWRSRSCGRASLGTTLLLFANSFGAVATAYGLTGSSLNIVHHPALRADPRRRAAQPESRLCARARHDRDHGPLERRLYLAARAQREVAAMKRSRLGPWLAIVIGTLYFLVPLIATFEFSLRMQRGAYSFEAYRVVLADPRFQATFGYSTLIAVATIVVGVLLVVPTAYWIAAALPQAAPAGRVHHAAAARHPGDRHRLRLSAHLQLLLAHPADGDAARHRSALDLRLRDAGAALHVSRRRYGLARDRRPHADRGRREPRRRLGHHPVQGDLPECARRACSRGAFLTFAIVIGEFTMASLLDRPAFGPYLQLIGRQPRL